MADPPPTLPTVSGMGVEMYPSFNEYYDKDYATFIADPSTHNTIGWNSHAIELFGLNDKSNRHNHDTPAFFPPTQSCGRNSLELRDELESIAMTKGFVKYFWDYLHQSGKSFRVKAKMEKIVCKNRTYLKGTILKLTGT